MRWSNPAAARRWGLSPLFAVSLSLLPLTLSVAQEPTPAPAQAAPAQAAPPSQITGSATWDDRYLYFAFRVDDTDILGTNVAPLSNAAEDDSVGVYFHFGTERPAQPTVQTRAMIVSAAGGFTFLKGDGMGKLVPDRVLTIKYGVTLQGTLNRSDDRDKGYTVTLAVPFDALGVDPATLKPGTEVAFTAVARMRGGGLTATAEGVKTEEDVNSPAKWGKLVLGAPDAAPVAGAMLSPRIAATGKPPLIDGGIRGEEWPASGALAFTSPDVPKAAVVVAPTVVPGADTDTVVPSFSLTPETATSIEKRIFARYILGYQGDTRKVISPARGIFLPDATMVLGDQPASGIGPWFSNDRTDWHRSQLAEMRRVGIDAALVQISGPQFPLAPLDEKAVLVMVGALREMSADNVPTPQVVPCIETGALLPPNTTKADLNTKEGRDTLYRAIQRWFNLIPAEYRAAVTMPIGADGRIVRAYPVFLSDGTAVTVPTNAEWITEMQERFAKEFGRESGGITLVFVGGDGFSPESGVAAVTPLIKGGKGAGLIPTAVVQPGSEGLNTPLVPRKDGMTYRNAFEQAIAGNAVWTIIDSWNDWIRGTEIAPSRQYGSRYLDLTRILTVQSAGLQQRDVRWLANDAPRRMRPGQIATVSVTLRNAGTQTLDSAALSYRWKQDGKVVAEGPLRLALTSALLPTQTLRQNIGVVAGKTTETGGLTPLPPGNYTLEIGLTDSPRMAPAVFFGENPPNGSVPAGATGPLRVNVGIQDDLPDLIEIGGTTTPPLLIGGATYPVLVRVRWMGKTPLLPDAANLVYQILSEDGTKTIVSTAVPLRTRLEPGLWTTVIAPLKVGDAGGPLPPAFPENRKSPDDVNVGGYKVRWLLSRTQSTDAVPGEYIEQVAVYPPDDEARILPPAKTPSSVQADELVPMEVTVINRGATKWAKGQYSIGYHWYYPDGLEAEWKPSLAASLPHDLAPGESVKVMVTVRCPDRDGEYVLAFDVLKEPDTYLSTHPVTRTGDIAVVPMRVVGGRLAFVDLSKLFDTDGVATEQNPGDGDLDGKGFSLPAESFPPDKYGIAAFFATDKDGKPVKSGEAPAYPSGHFSEGSPTARLTSFRYGMDGDKQNNAVACNGQVIPLPKGKFSGLHFAAAATGGQDRPLSLIIRYKDGTVKRVTPTVGDWSRLPGEADPVAIRTNRKRHKDGDKGSVTIVRHIIVALDVSKEILSVKLPEDKDIKVFAITLEK